MRTLRALRAMIGAIGLTCAAAAGAQDFPDGPGLDVLRTRCRICHMPDRVTKVAGRSVEGWQALVNTMINRGAPVTEDEVPILVEYLATNWPVDKRVETINYTPLAPMAAHVRAEFTEWAVPTPASRPATPLAASDGSIWYAGQAAKVLGRLDPKGGVIREYPLRTPRIAPSGLAEDRGGNIWYAAAPTAESGSKAESSPKAESSETAEIGMLDPRSGTFSAYPITNQAARDPRAIIVDSQGNVWFTSQEGNLVGRFNPATRQFSLRSSPTPSSRPDGLAIGTRGPLFFAESAANKVASVDPATMAIREWMLPDPDARPRRLAVDAGGLVWFTDYARGCLGRLDPASGSVKEWPSPGGPASLPYAIAALNGDIWYSESGAAPNTLVRFEPATERFQIWNIPSGGAVEQISVGRDGSLALAEAELGKIALVKISR